MHFAAFIQAGESVQEPLKSYHNNCANAINLLSAMMDLDIRKFIFSSTAAVYGHSKQVPIMESEPVNPINPYGWSKALVEKVLADSSIVKDFRYIAHRYFNAAGADPLSRIGERHNPETHLNPLILKAA